MKKFILLPFLLFTLISSAQINKVEHFFVISPDAEKLFNFFRDTFQLPVIWKYQQWKEFATGGLSLGNIAFEFVNYEGVDDTKFAGIALEPKQHLEEFTPYLDQHGIAHDTIQNSIFTDATGVLVGWSTLELPDLLLSEASIFICDYKNRDGILENRRKGAESLRLNNGGPLGIVKLQEIVIATNEFEKHMNAFAALPGIIKETEELYAFDSGPSIRLIKSSNSSITKIVIKIASLAAARNYLTSKNLLGETTETSIFIDEKPIDGLKIELIQ